MEEKSAFDKNTSLALKGFLVVIMFWSHMFNHPERLAENIEWISIGSIFGKKLEIWLCTFTHVAVPLFFFVGGYGFYLTHKETLSDNKIRKQIKKVYTKYWVAFLIFIPICFLLRKLKFEPIDFLLNFVGLNSTYCGEWWFLSTYIEIMVCMYFVGLLCQKCLKKELKNIPSRFIVIASLIVCGGGYTFKFICRKFGINAGYSTSFGLGELYYLLIKQPLFVMGYVAAKNKVFDLVVNKLRDMSFIVRIVLNVFLYICVLGLPYLYSAFLTFVPETFFYAIYDTIFCCGFCVLFDKKFPIFKKALNFTGKYSTYMWLVHSLLLYKIIQPVIYAAKVSILCWLTLVIISLGTAVVLTNFESLLSKICYRVGLRINSL